MEHVCVICGAPLAGHRRHALTCSGPCRAERARLLAILGGHEADGYSSLAGRLAVTQKRTRRLLRVA